MRFLRILWMMIFIDVKMENSKYLPQSLKVVIQTGCGYDEVPTLTSLIRARIILNSRD